MKLLKQIKVGNKFDFHAVFHLLDAANHRETECYRKTLKIASRESLEENLRKTP